MDVRKVKFHVGERIRIAPAANGMTQRQLAAAPGVSSSSQQVGKYELGRQDMTITKLYRLAAALQVDPKTLLP